MIFAKNVKFHVLSRGVGLLIHICVLKISCRIYRNMEEKSNCERCNLAICRQCQIELGRFRRCCTRRFFGFSAPGTTCRLNVSTGVEYKNFDEIAALMIAIVGLPFRYEPLFRKFFGKFWKVPVQKWLV